MGGIVVEGFFQNIKTLSNAVEQSEEKVRKSVVRLFKNTTEPNPSIKDMAELIIAHPEANLKSVQLLNVCINQYHLKRGSVEYRLETRGKDDQKIMEVDIIENGVHLIKYRTYDGKEKLKEKNRLSKDVFFSLFE